MTEKTIFMITESGYPVFGSGGLEHQITTVSKALLRRGVKVKVIAPMLSEAPQTKTDTYEGIDVYRIAYPKLPLVGALIMLAKLALYLIRQRKKFDALHCHAAHNTAAVSCLMGRILRKPVVVKLTGWWETNHGILKENPVGLHTHFLRWAIGKASYYQTISSHLETRLLAQGFEENKIIRLPNAVDTGKFIPHPNKATAKAATNYRAKVVGLFTGRLVPEKGLHMLVDAWIDAFDSEEDAALIILGDGELERDLGQKIQSCQRGHQIFLPGPTDHVQQYLDLADYGLLTSLHEGLSNTLLEYLSSGLPVIGSKISGTEDVVAHNKSGWLFNSGDQSELTKYLIELKNTDADALGRMGQAGRAFIQQYAGIDAIADRLLELYSVRNN